jgi:hypothetical protein
MSHIEDKQEEIQQEADEKNTTRLLSSGLTGLIVVSLIALTVLAAYFLKFGYVLSDSQGDWGVFGDYLGGTLNPAVGLVTVYLVLINVIIQRKEFKNSVREMKNSNNALKLQNKAIAEQSFQTTFFNWINTYNNIVSNTQWTGPSGGPPYGGHSALSSMYQYTLINGTLRKSLEDKIGGYQHQLLIDDPDSMHGEPAAIAEKTILEIWEKLKLSREDYFEGGFRSLTGVIFWVAEQPAHRISEAKKFECMRIIESQTTNAEKVFLLYEYWTMTSRKRSIFDEYRLLSRLQDSNDPYAKFMLKRVTNISNITTTLSL